MSTETFHFFWKGPLSQWATRHHFTYAGIEFNCAEQWMMFCKALLFKDFAQADEILAEPSPKEQQGLGRGVKNFNQKVWEDWRKLIVYTGNYLRATQNSDMLELLLKTPCDTFVEASPIDQVWGIKLNADDPRALDRTQWKGLNLLGAALTAVRNYLRDPATKMVQHVKCFEMIARLFADYFTFKQGAMV